jgi:phosphatidylinositol 4-kinase
MQYKNDSWASITGGEIRFGDGWLNTMYRQKDNPLPLLKKRKEKFELDTVKEYIRKRNLILELLAQEVRFKYPTIFNNQGHMKTKVTPIYLMQVDVLMAWHNPLNSGDLIISGEATINTWRLMKSSDKMWRESVQLAWEINPILAVYLPQRLKSSEKSVVSEEVSRLVRYWPDNVMDNSEALIYLVTSDIVLNDIPEVRIIASFTYLYPISSCD